VRWGAACAVHDVPHHHARADLQRLRVHALPTFAQHIFPRCDGHDAQPDVAAFQAHPRRNQPGIVRTFDQSVVRWQHARTIRYAQGQPQILNRFAQDGIELTGEFGQLLGAFRL
jgi:hypothetical protein